MELEKSDCLQVICEGGKCNGKTDLPKSKKERDKPIDFLEENRLELFESSLVGSAKTVCTKISIKYLLGVFGFLKQVSHSDWGQCKPLIFIPIEL
jgi:hypothetical protein